MVNASGTLKENGAVDAVVTKDTIFGIDMVYSTTKAKKLPFVKFDILGQTRGEAVIGAFQNKGMYGGGYEVCEPPVPPPPPVRWDAGVCVGKIV